MSELPSQPKADDEAAGREGPRLSHCRSCRAPIYWARMDVTLGLMPVDEAVSPEGQVRLTFNRKTGEVIGHLLRADEQKKMTERYRQPHFVTCPDSAAWKTGSHEGKGSP